MLIIAIDTSDRNGSVALCRGGTATFEVLGFTAVEGGSYSARLVPCITDLLSHAESAKTQVDGFVVVDGPGSFTGLRVGLSTVKALCEVLQKPLATVSMLEALAVTYGREGEVVNAVLDAGRGEVYVGEYAIATDGVELRHQRIVRLADFLSELPALQLRVITTIASIAGATVVNPQHAEVIARIGLRKLLAGQTVNLATLDANYIRRSDAELFSVPER